MKRVQLLRLVVIACTVVSLGTALTSSIKADQISDMLIIKKHDGTVVDSLEILEESAGIDEGSAGLTVKTLAEGLNVAFNSPMTAYILEQGVSRFLVVSDTVSLNIHQDPDQKLMVDFDFTFTSDPHSGLKVPDGTPESQLFTENDGMEFDITSALLPFRVPEGSHTVSQPFVITAISDLDPVPEPGSFLLLLTSLGGLVLFKNKRRNGHANWVRRFTFPPPVRIHAKRWL